MFQVRHRVMGIFQGIFLDVALWWPDEKSEQYNTEEGREYRDDPVYQLQGIHPLPRDVAQDLIDLLVEKGGMAREDLTIEPFDQALDDALAVRVRNTDPRLS